MEENLENDEHARKREIKKENRTDDQQEQKYEEQDRYMTYFPGNQFSKNHDVQMWIPILSMIACLSFTSLCHVLIKQSMNLYYNNNNNNGGFI